MNIRTGEDGLSLLELLVSIAILLAVSAAVFELMSPAYGVFDLQLERIDMHQRLRASVDTLFHELLVAGAGAAKPAVAPRRRGVRSADPAASVFPDRVSISYVPPDGAATDTRTVTYWMRPGPDSRGQLMRYDGQDSELPVVDCVSSMRFDYFGAGDEPIDRQRFGDGPWVTDGASGEIFDQDLLAVRRIRVIVRVGAARQLLRSPLPDEEIAMDVSPRNLNQP